MKALAILLFICVPCFAQTQLGPLGPKYPRTREKSPLKYQGYYFSVDALSKEKDHFPNYGDMVFKQTRDFTNLAHVELAHFYDRWARQDFKEYTNGRHEQVLIEWLDNEVAAGKKLIVSLAGYFAQRVLLKKANYYLPNSFEDLEEELINEREFIFYQAVIYRYRKQILGVQLVDEPSNQIYNHSAEIIDGANTKKWVSRRIRHFYQFIFPFVYKYFGKDLHYGMTSDNVEDLKMNIRPNFDWVSVNNYLKSYSLMARKQSEFYRYMTKHRKWVSRSETKDRKYFRSHNNVHFDPREDHPRCKKQYLQEKSKWHKKYWEWKRDQDSKKIHALGRHTILDPRYKAQKKKWPSQFEIDHIIEKEIQCERMNRAKLWLTGNAHSSTYTRNCSPLLQDQSRKTHFTLAPNELFRRTKDTEKLIDHFGIPVVIWFLWNNGTEPFYRNINGQLNFDFISYCGARSYKFIIERHKNLYIRKNLKKYHP